MEERVEILEDQVQSLDKERPGLMVRVDRLEWFVKALIALTSLGVVWKIIDLAGAVIAHTALRP